MNTTGMPGAGDVSGARGGSNEAEQHAQSRGLAGAVGAKESVNLAAADYQVEPVDRDDAIRIFLGQAVRGDDRIVGGGGHASA